MKNSTVIENNFLFLDVAQAISHLNEGILRFKKRNYLIVVLSEEAMPVANTIARESRLGVALPLVRGVKPATRPTNEVQFDFHVVKESGRDLPQDFIFHEERNLKAKMMSWYDSTYKQISSQYPNKGIILVDALTNDGIEFRQKSDRWDRTAKGRRAEPDSNNSAAAMVARRFVYLHLIHADGNGINMVIEQ